MSACIIKLNWSNFAPKNQSVEQLSLKRETFGAAKSTFTGIHRVNTAAKTTVDQAISFSICSFSLCFWALQQTNWLTFCFSCWRKQHWRLVWFCIRHLQKEQNTGKSLYGRGGGCEGHTFTITPTQHSDVRVGFLRRIRVELAHVASLVGEWHIGQRYTQFALREIDQLEPAVLQSCGIIHVRQRRWGRRGQGHKCEKERGRKKCHRKENETAMRGEGGCFLIE